MKQSEALPSRRSESDQKDRPQINTHEIMCTKGRERRGNTEQTSSDKCSDRPSQGESF